MPDAWIKVSKYAFYKSFVKLTSDLPLVVCTCSLQVGLVKIQVFLLRKFIELDLYQVHKCSATPVNYKSETCNKDL